MDRLEEEMARIRTEIENERKANLEVQERERAEVERKINEFKKREAMLKETRKKQMFELSQLGREIKEANQICELMERRITFKQCYVRVIKREAEGRRMSVIDDLMVLDEDVEEELQIRVTNQEKNSVVMWDV